MELCGVHVTISGFDFECYKTKFKNTEVFEHDGEYYVKYNDFSELSSMLATLLNDSQNESIKYARRCNKFLLAELDDARIENEINNKKAVKYKRQARKRGKLIARLQKKLHNCYFTIFELQKLCAILLQNDDNFNLCMVKTGLPTYFLMKMRNWKGLRDE